MERRIESLTDFDSSVDEETGRFTSPVRHRILLLKHELECELTTSIQELFRNLPAVVVMEIIDDVRETQGVTGDQVHRLLLETFFRAEKALQKNKAYNKVLKVMKFLAS